MAGSEKQAMKMQLTISLKMLIILLHRQKVLTRMAVDMAIFPRNTPKMSNALSPLRRLWGQSPWYWIIRNMIL